MPRPRVSRPASGRQILLALMTMLLTTAFALGTASPASAAQQHHVVISGFAFQPQTLSINAGDTVTWVNDEEGETHTTTSDSGVWNSGDLDPGESFSYTFRQAGNFGYHCEPHPFMTGTIVVN